MKTKYEMDLSLRTLLMGEAALIGENFIVTKSYVQPGVYKGLTYKIIAIEGDFVSIELVVRDDRTTKSIGERYVARVSDLITNIRFVSPEFVRTYK